jgi:hypothetical protein
VSVRRFLSLLVALALVTVTAGCGGGGGGSAEDFGRAPSEDGGDDGGSGSSGAFDLDFGGADDEDLSNRDLIEVIQQFWEDGAAAVGFPYDRLSDERIAGIPGDPPPNCQGFEIRPEDVAMNAFAAPCPEGLTVAWDPGLIDGTLTDLFGGAGPAVVFAHEWGHVVQFQSGILDITGQGIGDPPSVLTENQADCFSGAWVAEQVDDGFGPFTDPSALDNSIGAMIFVRDQPGSDPQGELAHGSGFDRVRAFQDGFEGGIEYCFGYLEDPPFIDELPFTEQDAANQGNLPFADVTDLVVEDLEDYFSANVDGFEGPGDPFDTVPADELDALHAEVGDGAVATVFGMLWAARAQAAAGDDLDGEGPLLQRSCLVGSWLGDILRDQRDGQVDRESGVSLSPGDLDETIITFLKLTEDAMAGSGVAFEAIADMRLGVFGGIEDCRLGE